MIAAVHALVGATLARFCDTRTQAALIGGASHALLDMLPHRDFDIPEEGFLLAGALTTICAAKGSDSREFAGAVGAVLPDLENLIGRVCGVPDEKLLLPTHRHLHGPKTRSFVPQLALASLGLVALFVPNACRADASGRGTSSR
ncbi:MAG: hypothetical protein JXA57_09005 [Armatimonadetes bacterium]|nr:hypothetical protein [Armatimonadota bacterium]